MPVRGNRARARHRPNILFVLADEWRAQAFGHMGGQERAHPSAGSLQSRSGKLPGSHFGHARLLSRPRQHRDRSICPDERRIYQRRTIGADRDYARSGVRGRRLPDGLYRQMAFIWQSGGQLRATLSYIPPEFRFGFEYWKACECTHQYNHSLYYDGDDTTPKYWQGYDALAQTDDAIGYIDDKSRGSDPYFWFSLGDRPIFPIRRRKNIRTSIRLSHCAQTFRMRFGTGRSRSCAATMPQSRSSTIASLA